MAWIFDGVGDEILGSFGLSGGGAVFSTGSITFCGSLSHAHYDNNVSRILFNVLNRFGGLGLGWPL